MTTEAQMIARYGYASRQHLQYRARIMELTLVNLFGYFAPETQAHHAYMRSLGIQF